MYFYCICFFAALVFLVVSVFSLRFGNWCLSIFLFLGFVVSKLIYLPAALVVLHAEHLKLEMELLFLYL